MTSEPTPQITVTVAAPSEAVWEALRDKEKIRHWHGWEFEGLDEEIDLIYFTAYTEDATAHTLDIQGGDVIRVEPTAGGSRVTLTRAPHGTDPEWDAYYDDVTEGWTTFLHQLRFALERHPDDARRTVFLAGVGATSPVDALGLAEVATRPAGSAYEAALQGEAVHGIVWFRSENQVGLSVDEWGDGLLVLSHLAPSQSKPAGAAMAVLSLYGGDAPTYEAVDRRWQGWWTQRYPTEPAESSADGAADSSAWSTGGSADPSRSESAS